MEEKPMKSCCVMLERYTPKKQVGLSAEIHNEIQQRNMLTARTKQKVLQALDRLQCKSEERNRNNRRNKIVSEILTSEISYQKQLTILKDYFMVPIKQRDILTNDEYDTLFCNIRTIMNISSELLRELQKELDIVNAFTKIVPFFKHYSVYAYHYKQSLQMLQILSMSNSAFSKLLEMQESRPEVQLKLSALLITPIQRIPRYCLLIEELIESTPVTHPSYLALTELLKKVESVALHLNNLIQDQENAQLLLEFQRSLLRGFPSIIRPGRKLIKKGILNVLLPNKQKSKRCFVLMSDILIYCKIKKSDINLPNSLKCTGIFPLHKCKVAEILTKGALEITCEDERITVYHECAVEIEEWSRALNLRIKQYLSERRTLRKDSSARRPAHKRNLDEYQEVGISPGIPRKKRLIMNQNDGENLNQNKTNHSTWKPTKRKCIKDYSSTKSHQTSIKNEQDCLYPLRELIGQQTNDIGSNKVIKTEVEETEPTSTNNENTNMEVFVFGKNSQPRGFNFGMKTIFSGIGNSFKRFFGFGR